MSEMPNEAGGKPGAEATPPEGARPPVPTEGMDSARGSGAAADAGGAPGTGPLTPPPAPPAPYGDRRDAFGRPYPEAIREGSSPAPAPTASRQALKHRNTGLIVASLIVGALIGGAAGGAGGGLIGSYTASHGGQASNLTTTGPANITVNDTKSATMVTAVAAKASPSVVTINVAGAQESGTGSGIVLTEDGYVLTNTHVVTLDGDAANVQVSVTDNNGKIYKAKIVGTDPVVDLAVIKLDGAHGMSPATFADSSKVNVGQAAVAIGAPLGLSGTVTDGIVSSVNRSISIASSAAPKNPGGREGSPDQDGGQEGGENPFNFWNFAFPGPGGPDGGGQTQQSSPTNRISLPVLQTDAAINPGNSGGPLLDSQGDVIGVNVAIASAGNSSGGPGDQSGSIGVGFAIPADLAQRVGHELMTDHHASHGLLGAMVTDSTADSDASTVGALIRSVTGGGAAAEAGLRAGDIVTNFNGRPIQGSTDLTAQVRYLAGGSTARLVYVRGGSSHTVRVTLGTMKDD